MAVENNTAALWNMKENRTKPPWTATETRSSFILNINSSSGWSLISKQVMELAKTKGNKFGEFPQKNASSPEMFLNFE